MVGCPASFLPGAALTEIRSLARLLGGMVRGVVSAENRPPPPISVRFFSYDDLRGMYYPLHEADESKFIETLLRKLDALDENRPTRLRARREAFGLSQSELARRANVGLRAIQMYEQRNKDINHAQGATLYRLSRALGCGMEDLLER